MSAVTTASPRPAGPSASRHVMLALARLELRRVARSPWAPVGLALSWWMLWSLRPTEGEWPGATYQQMATTSLPLLFAISVTAAVSFHRARTEVAAAVPVREGRRSLARLVGLAPLVPLAVVFAGAMAWRQRDLGGLWLGVEPGRTTEALYTAGELAQHVALAVVAVGLGAALGRRTSRLAATIPLIFVIWFVVFVYWLFAHRAVTPFSVLQVQPIQVPVGPETADPLSFPSHWLLEGPGEYSDFWSRAFVSEALAWWHDVWLVGLAALLLAAAFPRGVVRRRLLVLGSALAVLGAAAQVMVIP